MILSCVEQPEVEPITLSDVEGQCRIEVSDEASTVNIFIKAVRERAESVTRRSLITQTWELTLDEFPSGIVDKKIYLPKPPLQTVDSIKYIDTNGVEQTLDPSLYKVVNKCEPGYVQPAYGKAWPVTRNDSAVVTIEFTCGYGPIDPDTSLNVPAGIIQWMLLNVATLYENRELEGIAQKGTVFNLNTIADGLIENYRISRL